MAIVLSEYFIRHYRMMTAPEYVCAYVCSHSTSDWNIYCTQTLQYGCSQMWMRWCQFRTIHWLNDFLHTLQEYEPYPLCMPWCIFKPLLQVKVSCTHHRNTDAPFHLWVDVHLEDWYKQGKNIMININRKKRKGTKQTIKEVNNYPIIKTVLCTKSCYMARN